MTYRINRWVALLATVGTVLLALVLATGRAQANEFPALDTKTVDTTTILWSTCPNLKNWYVNEDETDQRPEATQAGLKFTGKDLIHHAVSPIDFTAFDNSTRSFTANGDTDKVVLKFETTAPYGNLVIQPDGKIWHTAVSPDSVGGQNHPVAHAADLFADGVVMKAGKAKFSSDSKVTTVGVGYWTEAGSTVVSEVRFHGVIYPLTCAAPHTGPSGTPATTHPTTRPTGKPTVTPTHPAPSSSSPTSMTPPVNGNGKGGGSNGGALAITGPSTWVLVLGGVGVVAFGGLAFLLARRRRIEFSA